MPSSYVKSPHDEDIAVKCKYARNESEMTFKVIPRLSQVLSHEPRTIQVKRSKCTAIVSASRARYQVQKPLSWNRLGSQSLSRRT